MNFISSPGGGVNCIKLYLSFNELNPSKPAAVPPTRTSSTILVLIS